MSDESFRERSRPATSFGVTTSLLLGRRRLASLQLVAMSTRAGRYRTRRVAHLRATIRHIDEVLIARGASGP